MGVVKHNAIVVVGFDCIPKHDINAVHSLAINIFGNLVSEIVNGVCNGYKSFFIAPDGSKEGWEDSIIYDEKREEFYRRVDKSYVDIIEVRFGDDCVMGEIINPDFEYDLGD